MMLRLILIIFILCAALNVFGRDNKGRKMNKHWGCWSCDTTYHEDGMQIIKERQRYLRNTHGHKNETLIFKYDLCGHLIQKSKEYHISRCFSGDYRMVYDRHYKSNCKKK